MVVGLNQIRGRPELFAPVGSLPPGVVAVELDAPTRNIRRGPQTRRRRRRRHVEDNSDDEDESFFGCGLGGGSGGSSVDSRLEALMQNRVLYDEMRRDLQICMLGGVALLEGVIILALLSSRRD